MEADGDGAGGEVDGLWAGRVVGVCAAAAARGFVELGGGVEGVEVGVGEGGAGGAGGARDGGGGGLGGVELVRVVLFGAE